MHSWSNMHWLCVACPRLNWWMQWNSWKWVRFSSVFVVIPNSNANWRRWAESNVVELKSWVLFGWTTHFPSRASRVETSHCSPLLRSERLFCCLFPVYPMACVSECFGEHAKDTRPCALIAHVKNTSAEHHADCVWHGEREHPKNMGVSYSVVWTSRDARWLDDGF